MLWTAADVADYLGIDRNAAAEMMQSGVIESRRYRDIVPGARSDGFRTTKYHVIDALARIYGDNKQALHSFYQGLTHEHADQASTR